MTKKHKKRADVWAAGAVVWRPGPSGSTAAADVEIAVVHRPRYDDWTIPKGKGEPGETLVDTAVREIAEETGQHIVLGRHLGDVHYDLDSGRKHVRYWAARGGDGTFAADDEVDELRWLTVEKADATLTYELDRQILREFARLPADLHTLLLVRHAKAGRRADWDGDDRRRPLDALGRRQAEALVPLLTAFGAERVHAADRVRCEQTLDPLRAELGVECVSEPTLSEEAYRADPAAAQRRIRELAARPDVVAVCSQGKVIPPLMRWWADEDGLDLPEAANRKGSVWVCSLDRGRLVAADHIAGPLPHD
ncbi:NUDIX hydrolase [Gordonia paraffinivorans]|uniref:NTP pyrophosphohydrolase MutT n=2 Tax=Gordonia paraffinivorans TaxID=175628 RepID=A0ABQ0IJ48_9ACTN|nr:NUDIX hydrolase [Gordonia paraffinivorans]MCD2143886.1 NUDIX hydrolase [Gordonia paraffinivorans]GAC83610.1 NTP pyrophosphohydrolase MutT [Gordonia paraffinivorans NBRC 108238]VFA81115.1 Predicted NTP pyrophosphohydrolase [Gordonia paraffinivorans]